MKECLLDDFLERMRGWLSSETVRKVYLTDNDQLVVIFADDARSVYRIKGCSAEHIRKVLEEFQERGLDVAIG